MLILEEYVDTWNYTFIIVAVVAVSIGAFLSIRNINKQEAADNKKKQAKEDIEKSSNETHE